MRKSFAAFARRRSGVRILSAPLRKHVDLQVKRKAKMNTFLRFVAYLGRIVILLRRLLRCFQGVVLEKTSGLP
jgi:hypothetical protein